MGCAAGKDASANKAKAESKPKEERRESRASQAKNPPKKDSAPSPVKQEAEKPAPPKEEATPTPAAAPVVAQDAKPETQNETKVEEVVPPTSDKPVLRGHPLSQPCRSVQWYINYTKKDIEITTVDVLSGEHKKPEYLAKHPAGQIPAYEEGDFNLSESYAILQYISKDDAEFKLDGKEAIKMDEYVGRHLSAVRKFTTECFRKALFAKTAEEGAQGVKEGFETIKPELESFDSRLNGQQFVLGDKITLADFLFAPEVDQLDFLDLLGPFENIGKYLERLREQDSYKESFEAAKAVFEKLKSFKAAEAAAAASATKPEETEKKEQEEPVEESPPTSDKPVLRGHPLSQPARSVQWYINHMKKDIEITSVDVLSGEHKKPEYLAKHPAGLVPAYEEGDFNLSESYAILQYISKDDAEFKLDGKEAIKMDEYVGRHLSAVRKFTTAVVRPALFEAKSKDDLEARLKEGLEKITGDLESFNARLGTQDFIIGDKLTLADFLFVPEVDQLQCFGLLESQPKITAYLERLREQYPEYKENYETAAKIIEQFKSSKE
eukprot:TRINITY_DN40_c1_g1_i1.p1 TRINITY_DN40_c1_g1~~TRINITY_DN40_c1_g1_i1.p1  ORF type:complete len:551 (+),score=116.52 TRINITY_DN40_c1_g1_i1:68-1720(+)